MDFSSHCESLGRLQLAWEANVHSSLGYFPSGFRQSCREHVLAYLNALEQDLEADLREVRDARVRLLAGAANLPPSCEDSERQS